MRYILIALCGLLFSTAATAGLSLPSPFQSHYKVFRNGSEVGVGQRIFYAGSDNRLYFCSESHLKWLFLSDHRKEQSWLSFKEDRVMPLEYQFDRTGTGPNRSSHLMFDLKQKTIQELKDDYPLQAGWEEDLLDPVGYQLQMRMDVAAGKKSLRYKILSRGKIKEYQFEYVADEALKLPIGTVNTVKYKRAGNRGSRETFVWLSKDHDYVLARLWQSEDGKEQADLKLATFKFLEPSIPSL